MGVRCHVPLSSLPMLRGCNPGGLYIRRAGYNYFCDPVHNEWCNFAQRVVPAGSRAGERAPEEMGCAKQEGRLQRHEEMVFPQRRGICTDQGEQGESERRRS